MFDRLRKMLVATRHPTAAAVADAQVFSSVPPADKPAQPTHEQPAESATTKVQGDRFLQAGLLDQAAACYRQAVATDAQDADSTLNLGYICLQQKDLKQARQYLQAALVLQPASIDALYLLGLTELEEHAHAAAAGFFRTAIALAPGFENAYVGLCNALMAGQQHAEASVLAEGMVSRFPDDSEAHRQLGSVHLDAGDFARAIPSLQMALSIDAANATAHHHLALALQAVRRSAEAAAHFAHALSHSPTSAAIHNDFGLLLREQGMQPAAEIQFNEAVRLSPEFAEAFNNLGLVCRDRSDVDGAVRCHREAIRLKPELASAHNNLGIALQEKNDVDGAIASYRHALMLMPEFAEAQNNLGGALQFAGKMTEAIDAYRSAVCMRPDFFQARSNLLYACSFDDGNAQRYREACAEFGRLAAGRAKAFTRWRTGMDIGRTTPLRVGLVSGDFLEHPVGFFLEAVLGLIDRTNIQLIAYPTQPTEDGLTARLKPSFTEWHLLTGLDDAAAAAKIHGDGIDILIDLAGHTAHNRLPLFAWKPAPVQVSWLGYWASTGVPGMDYVLTDRVCAPPKCQAQFTETLWYLPQTRMCFTPPADAPAVSLLPALQHDDRHLTFGSFQNGSKISDATLALWARVLAALPTARLRLQNKQLSQDSGRVAMQERMAAAGIAPDRVELAGAVPMAQYLADHAQVDILLDTFPFPGGTTTCEALWMGVPTLTLPGQTMLSRQGVSMLQAAGLPDWIAENENDYVALARRLVDDLPALARLRTGLREQVCSSPLFDAKRFAKDLDAALTGMYASHRLNTPC